MSDLIAPVVTQPAFWDPATGQRTTEDSLGIKILAVLNDIRTELRLQNAILEVGFNLQDDLDALRKDPYYTDPSTL
jgi:hypothetical protein